MSQANISEGVTSENASFTPEITRQYFLLLQNIICTIPEKEEKLSCYDEFGLPIEFLQKQADSILARGNNLYALRYYASGAVLSAQVDDKESADQFRLRMKMVCNILESKSDFSSICKKTNLFFKAIDEYELGGKPIDFIHKPYMDLVFELGFDDFHDKHYWCYINLEKKPKSNYIEFLFFHWVHRNRKVLKLAHLDYIRDPLNNHSRAYVILRKEFNKKILKCVSQKNVQSGTLLLKMAYEIQEYDPPLASKYAAKARAVFDACQSKQGVVWVNQFHQNIFREHFSHCGVDEIEVNDLPKSLHMKLNVTLPSECSN